MVVVAMEKEIEADDYDDGLVELEDGDGVSAMLLLS